VSIARSHAADGETEQKQLRIRFDWGAGRAGIHTESPVGTEVQTEGEAQYPRQGHGAPGGGVGRCPLASWIRFRSGDHR